MRRVAKLTSYAKQTPLLSHLHLAAKPDSSELYSCTSSRKPQTASAGWQLHTHKACQQILWAQGSCVNEGGHGRGTATPPTAAPHVVTTAKMQPVEAVPGRLLENFCRQCTLTHNKVGPLTHLPNPVVFCFGSEENKNTLGKPYPLRSCVCFSMFKKNILK